MALPKLLKHLKDLGALSAGDLLKYDGEKLAKAVPGTDYADVELLTWTPYLQVGGATAVSYTHLAFTASSSALLWADM